MKIITTEATFHLWDTLHQCHFLIAKNREHELSEYNLSISQASILQQIKHSQKPMTISRLSRNIFRERHSISEIINRMVNSGLLIKEKNEGNLNQIVIKLTDQGEKAYEFSMRMDTIHENLSILSDEERECLGKLLTALRDKALDVMWDYDRVD